MNPPPTSRPPKRRPIKLNPEHLAADITALHRHLPDLPRAIQVLETDRDAVGFPATASGADNNGGGGGSETSAPERHAMYGDRTAARSADQLERLGELQRIIRDVLPILGELDPKRSIPVCPGCGVAYRAGYKVCVQTECVSRGVKPTCSVEGCDAEATRRGLCSRCNMAKRRPAPKNWHSADDYALGPNVMTDGVYVDMDMDEASA